MRYYWPSNMYDRPQQAYTTKFHEAMTAWKALTDEEKAPWVAKAIKFHQPRPNLFVKAYMLDRELEP